MVFGRSCKKDRANENCKEVEKYTYLASFEALKESDFNFNILCYADTFEKEAEFDIEIVQKGIEILEGQLARVSRAERWSLF